MSLISNVLIQYLIDKNNFHSYILASAVRKRFEYKR